MKTRVTVILCLISAAIPVVISNAHRHQVAAAETPVRTIQADGELSVEKEADAKVRFASLVKINGKVFGRFWIFPHPKKQVVFDKMPGPSTLEEPVVYASVAIHHGDEWHTLPASEKASRAIGMAGASEPMAVLVDLTSAPLLSGIKLQVLFPSVGTSDEFSADASKLEE